MIYEYYMKEAIIEAKKAYEMDEVPIGCIIVYNDTIIARAYNLRNKLKNSLAHAEIIAINEACKYLGDWRLEQCDIYITLEPCPMCSGAILQSRIKRLIFGSYNPKAGCAGSIINMLQLEKLNHRVNIVSGILEQECSDILTQFFKRFRKTKSDKILVDNDIKNRYTE